MLSPADIIRLPYTPDLTEAGLVHAIRSLPSLHPRAGTSPAARLRSLTSAAAVQLAFRRHLTQMGVPFSVREADPFTGPGRYDVRLAGQRCDIITFTLSRREEIRQVRGDPGLVLKAPALVPSDRHAAPDRGRSELYLFAFVTALLAASPRETEKALSSGQPACMLHALPPEWARPRHWHPLGTLALKSEADEPLTLELSGQDGTRQPLTCRVDLPPRTRVETATPFHSLACLHTDRPPGGRVGLHSPALGATRLIRPGEWENIRIYGIEILLAGYISRGEFSDRAVRVPPGSQVFQFARTRTRNLAVPVETLHPLEELFEGARRGRA